MHNRISITLEKKTLQKIDILKHKNEPRSRFVEDVILQVLGKKRDDSPQAQIKEK